MQRTSSSSSTAMYPVRPAGNAAVLRQPYARAAAVLNRMQRLPRMDAYEALARGPDMDLPEHLRYSVGIVPHGMPLDPVSVLRRMFRMGAPLTLVVNAVRLTLPATPMSAVSPDPRPILSLTQCQDTKDVKVAVYHFFEACKEVGLRVEDLFTISQVFQDSLKDFLPPLATVELLLARIEYSMPSRRESGSFASTTGGELTPTPTAASAATGTHGLSSSSAGGSKDAISISSQSTTRSADLDQRSRVVEELLATERKYVGDLELLAQYYDEMIRIGIPHVTAQRICPDIHALLAFQWRFLVGCEYHAGQEPENQRFGWLFLELLPDFSVYKQYTLAQKDAVSTAQAEIELLSQLKGLLDPVQGLPMLLLTPVQRIMRYPLLLQSVVKHTPEDWRYSNELTQALAAMREMMGDVNETQRQQENDFVAKELQDRVKDWKGADLLSMGRLLLSGSFPASGGNSDVEQDYSIFLFEKALLLCKERVIARRTPISRSKPQTPSCNSQTRSQHLELKGRIYLAYIQDAKYTKLPVGGYQLRLNWGHKNDALEHGHYDIRLYSEEHAQMWESTILKYAGKQPINPSKSSQRISLGSRRTSQSSVTQFWDDSQVSSPMDALRKLSVSSVSSQHSGGSRSSLPLTPSPNAVPAQIVASATAHYRNASNIGPMGNGHTNNPYIVTALSSANSSFSGGNMYSTVSPRSSQAYMSFSASLSGEGQRTVRINVDGDTFIVIVPIHIPFLGFMTRIEKKLKLTGKLPAQTQFRLEYMDEDGDRVRLESEEDMQVAFEAVPVREELNIYVTVAR